MIPQPAVLKGVAIAFIVFYLVLFAIGPWKLGPERFLSSLFHFSATWLIILILLPSIVFFARLGFPPKGSLPRLEVSRKRIRIVPGRIARLFAETPVEIDLAPQSTEILVCHTEWQGLGDGNRLVVRATDGTERQIRATSLDRLSALGAQRLVNGISAATGLPVILLKRSRREDGTDQEAPWNPPPRRSRIVRGSALAMGAVPFVGGSVVGVIWPTPAVIAAVGLGMWLSEMCALFLLSRWTGSEAKFPTPYSLSTVFTFAAAYGLAVVVVGYIFMGRQ